MVLFSHLHWDHVGDPSKFGPKTQFYIGPGAAQLIWSDGAYPHDEHSHFDSKLLPKDRATDFPLPSKEPGFWKPLGPFPETHDLLGDASVFVVNAPGHLPGHMNLLVREKSGWVLLGGDSCHHADILNGKAEISTYQDPVSGAMKCAHLDKPAAETHIKRLRRIREEGVEVILHHDFQWLDKNGDRFSVKA